MADIEKVTRSIDRCVIKRGNCHECDYYTQTEQDTSCRNRMLMDALELLKEQKTEIDRLKQGNLVNVDKLREKLGFAESCDKCKKNTWDCHYDAYFTEKDFCERLDTAIEELIQEGR